MTTIYLVLLILAGLAFAALGIRETYLFIIRKHKQAAFGKRKDTLVGVNPRSGRTVMHSTAPLKVQKMAWLVAHNMEITADELKDYAIAQSVDNSSLYVDTFKVRDGVRIHGSLFSLVARRVGSSVKQATESAGRAARRMNNRSRDILRWLSKNISIIGTSVRRLVKIQMKLGGEDQYGKDHSIYKAVSVRYHKDR